MPILIIRSCLNYRCLDQDPDSLSFLALPFQEMMLRESLGIAWLAFHRLLRGPSGISALSSLSMSLPSSVSSPGLPIVPLVSLILLECSVPLPGASPHFPFSPPPDLGSSRWLGPQVDAKTLQEGLGKAPRVSSFFHSFIPTHIC